MGRQPIRCYIAIITLCGACSSDTLPPIGGDGPPLDAAGDLADAAVIVDAAADALPIDTVIEPDLAVDAGPPPPSWQIVVNPSDTIDSPIEIAVDDEGLYVLGRVGVDLTTGGEWRLEKRALSDGSLIWGWNSSQGATLERATALGVDLTGLYLAGWRRDSALAEPHWVIEKRGRLDGDLDLGFGDGGVIELPGRVGGIVDLVLDAGGLYLLGSDQSLVDYGWRLEKRDPSLGGKIALFGGDGAVSTELAQATTPVALAADGGSLYVLAVDGSNLSDWLWVVEKRSKVNGATVGAFGTAGRASDNPTAAIDTALDIAVHGDGLFIVGFDQSISATDRQWRMQRWDKSSGAVQWSQVSNPSSPNAGGLGGRDIAYGLAVDGVGVYVAGSSDVPTDGRGRLERRDPASGAAVGTAVSFNPTALADALTRVLVDGPSLYLAGTQRQTLADQAWLLARRPRP